MEPAAKPTPACENENGASASGIRRSKHPRSGGWIGSIDSARWANGVARSGHHQFRSGAARKTVNVRLAGTKSRPKRLTGPIAFLCQGLAERINFDMRLSILLLACSPMLAAEPAVDPRDLPRFPALEPSE